jgi:hypothetical protein
MALAWYASGKTDIDRIRSRAHAIGEYMSTHLSILPGWNAVVEPLIISQLARIFVGMHAFTQGLTADNTNTVQIEKAMIEMQKTIADEIYSVQNN